MKYTVVSTERPPLPHACEMHRGKSPWNRAAFPQELADQAPEQGEWAEGWYIEDAWGNEIGFIADGTVIDLPLKEESTVPNPKPKPATVGEREVCKFTGLSLASVRRNKASSKLARRIDAVVAEKVMG